MIIPISHQLASTGADEFEIVVEDATTPEESANAHEPREVVVLVPDGVAYTLDRQQDPALSLATKGGYSCGGDRAPNSADRRDPAPHRPRAERAPPRAQAAGLDRRREDRRGARVDVDDGGAARRLPAPARALPRDPRRVAGGDAPRRQGGARRPRVEGREEGSGRRREADPHPRARARAQGQGARRGRRAPGPAKKMQLLLGGEDDDTDPSSAR